MRNFVACHIKVIDTKRCCDLLRNQILPLSCILYWFCCLFPLLFFQANTVNAANTSLNVSPNGIVSSDNSILPSKYGKVIYSTNETSSKQLYIIGISHRNHLNRRNGPNTSRNQVEVYRIVEWLNRNKNLELILPEGFFKRELNFVKDNSVQNKGSYDLMNYEGLDNQALEKNLADESFFINAEMLLIKNYNMKAEQVEDKAIYEAVSSRLVRLKDSAGAPYTSLVLQYELEYLQEIRTAAMLQKIPEIVESGFQRGNIQSKKAVFTIGLNHVNEIIRFLNENMIRICSPPFNCKIGKRGQSDLNLLKEGFGVTIIIPPTLAENQDILRMTKLNDDMI